MSAHASEASAHGSKRVRLSGPDHSQPFKSNTSDLVSAISVPPTANANRSDSESTLSESSEEPSDDSSSHGEAEGTKEELQEDQDRNGVVNLRANRGKKPTMKLGKEDLGPDMRPFLKQFLPKLKAANDELEAQKKAGMLKTLDADAGADGEQYIQMELGLGVFEEKHLDAPTSESDGSNTETIPKTQGILAKLMGHEDTGAMAGIEVVPDGKTLS